MLKIKYITLFSIIILLLTSCTKQLNSYFSKNNKNTDFYNIALELSKPMCKMIQRDTTVYITDYVNESNLKNKSQLGFLLSNQTKVNILDSSCTKNVKIQDLQLAKTLKINTSGSRILTRDINDMKNVNIKDDKQILIGSYILTQNQMIVFLKLVNLNNGDIIASSSVSREIDDEIKSLEGLITNKQIRQNDEVKIYSPMHL